MTPNAERNLIRMKSSRTTTYTLPVDWDTAIRGWVGWLKLGGARAATLRLRRDHIRSIARRSQTGHPRQITFAILVDLCSEREWSKDHRKAMRLSLVSFFEWAVINELAESNPAAKLPRVSGSPPAPRPVTDEVWRDLIDTAPPREQLMARLAGEAGMRRAEIATCHRSDLISDVGGHALLVHGKGGKQRAVPITKSLADAIAAYTDGGFLFPGETDGHLSAGRVGRVLSELMPPGWSAHKIRHRYATRGLAGTNNLLAVSHNLGHASVATTQRYCATTSQEARAVSEAAAGYTGHETLAVVVGLMRSS